MKKAINNPTLFVLPAQPRAIEFPPSTETIQSEEAIEARLRDLASLVADLTDSGFGVLLAEDPATREAFDELRVKEAALRWIVRVAKHSSGQIREKLWADIESAIAGLEKTASLLMHASFEGPNIVARAGHGRVLSH
jgi:hypothetical protein